MLWKRITLPIIFLIVVAHAAQSQQYQCPPCGCNSDDKSFDHAGACPSCSMPLINKQDPSDGYDYMNIYPGDICDTDKSYVFLDVRTKGEFKGRLGHLKGAINIHVDDLAESLSEIEQYRNRPILVYCLVSIRSIRASQFLVDNGFSDVTNMLGGMDLWNDLSTEDLPCKEELRVYR